LDIIFTKAEDKCIFVDGAFSAALSNQRQEGVRKQKTLHKHLLIVSLASRWSTLISTHKMNYTQTKLLVITKSASAVSVSVFLEVLAVPA